MKLFKLVIIFFVVGQIFATPLMRACEMMETDVSALCCSPEACACDDNLPEKIDALKKQVKTTSIDFHFDYEINSTLEVIIDLHHDEVIRSSSDVDIFYDPPSRFRAKLQVYII